jgi:uncharacterized protein (DUF1501 family)
MNATRRQFLKAGLGSAGVVCLGAGAPNFLLRAAETAGKNSDNVLVVLQLTGGNDGLNTIVPFDDPEYRRLRPELGIPTDQVLKIGDGLGFHPSLKGLAKLLEESKLGIVQGVGYPNPNRSHFESMDIWHTCVTAKNRNAGWLGRYLDASARAGGDLPALHFGGEQQPLALKARQTHVPSVQTLEKFKLQFAERAEIRAAAETGAKPRAAGDDLLEFLQTAKSAALASSRRVEESLGKYQTSITYPETDLARKLRTIAQLVDAGLGTRIYYVTLDGFDTHSNQPAAHAGLLTEFGDAAAAFTADAAEHGHGPRVTMMVFSEFGRRVKENASQGTDHGAAAPMFLCGERVKPGLIGKHPSLTDLDDGDQKFHTDFRGVYAALLEKWLGQPSAEILAGEFPPADVFAT